MTTHPSSFTTIMNDQSNNNSSIYNDDFDINAPSPRQGGCAKNIFIILLAGGCLGLGWLYHQAQSSLEQRDQALKTQQIAQEQQLQLVSSKANEHLMQIQQISSQLTARERDIAQLRTELQQTQSAQASEAQSIASAQSERLAALEEVKKLKAELDELQKSQASSAPIANGSDSSAAEELKTYTKLRNQEMTHALLLIAGKLGTEKASTLTQMGIKAYQNGQYEYCVTCYILASLKGDKLAQNNLGMRYANGQGTEKSHRMAIAWYHTAANQGQPHAQFNVAFYYEHAMGGYEKNMDLALMWYRKAAAQNLPEAIAALKRLGKY